MTPIDVVRVQRRTLRLLFGTQISGGIGTTIGVSIGGLLAARLGGTDVSGLAQSCSVIGAALLAVPVSRLMSLRGRRPGLALAYGLGAVGGGLVVLSAHGHLVWLLFAGMVLFGGGSAANLQARYSAVDLAPDDRRARQLSVIVWATTLGAVVSPNFANPADHLARHLGAPALTGPFFVSIVAFTVAALVIELFLRPDPLLTARRATAARTPLPSLVAAGPPDPSVVPAVLPAVVSSVLPGPPATASTSPDTSTAASTSPPAAGVGAAWRAVMASPPARLAIGTVATGHLVMVGVMAMTPVRIGMAGMAHGDGDVLRIVGLVLSVHVAGMYALSPLVGFAADRYGRRAVILGGIAALVSACALAGTAGDSVTRLMAGLALLGFGWSAMIVAGSTLLTESIEAPLRPSAQGLSDLVMGTAGAAAGALSGLVVSGPGYPTLTFIAAIATVPLLALALRIRTGGGRGPGIDLEVMALEAAE